MKMITLIVALVAISTINLSSRECLDNAWDEYKNQQFEKAIGSINSCIDDIISDGNEVEMNYAFFGLANNYTKLGEVDSALKYILIAHDIEKKYDLDQSKTLNELGIIYMRKGLNHDAIYFLKKALNLNRINKNSKEMSNNLLNISIVYSKIGILDSTTHYISKLESEGINIFKNKEIVLNSLAYIHFKNQNYKKSLEYLEKASKEISKNTSELDSKMIGSNLELLKVLNEKPYNLKVFEEYLSLTENHRSSSYFSDANYKMAIVTSIEKNMEEGIAYLNQANKLYVEYGDIDKAKEITSIFLSINGIKKAPLKYSLVKLNEIQNITYSKQLENSINARILSEAYIATIEEELYYSELSNYMMISFIVLFVLVSLFVMHLIRSNRYINSLIEGYSNYLNTIKQLDSSSVRFNLSKIANYMVLDKSFEGKDSFTCLVDQVIKDTNTMRKTVEDGINYKQTKRLYNV